MINPIKKKILKRVDQMEDIPNFELLLVDSLSFLFSLQNCRTRGQMEGEEEMRNKHHPIHTGKQIQFTQQPTR